MRLQLRRLLVPVSLVLATAVGLPSPGAQAASSSQARLKAAVAKALRGHGGRHLAYRVSDPAVGSFGRGAGSDSAPASNEKLFTTITLLQLVGPGFQYTTKVSGTAPIVGRVLDGSLVVRGSGDPNLSRATLVTFARRLHHQGLHHVTGHLIVDDTRYSHTTRVHGWKHNFVPTESGPISAFTVDHDAWRRSAAYLHNPTLGNAQLFRSILKRHHITVDHRIEVRQAPSDLKVLARHRSARLQSIVDATLTWSINYDAEMMFREAGAQLTGHGSPASGRLAVTRVAKRLGVPIGAVYDGSGLSYADRESPQTLTRWLRAVQQDEDFATTYQVLFYALPLSCETGTLVHRMCGTATRGEVRAKTGTLTHVSALSGYVVPRSDARGLPITFSFLASGVRDFNRLYRHVDAAVAVLRKQG